MDPFWSDVGGMALAYLKVLSWPIVVLIVAVLFREAIRELASRVTEAGFGGFRVKAAESARESAAASLEDTVAQARDLLNAGAESRKARADRVRAAIRDTEDPGDVPLSKQVTQLSDLLDQQWARARHPSTEGQAGSSVAAELVDLAWADLLRDGDRLLRSLGFVRGASVPETFTVLSRAGLVDKSARQVAERVQELRNMIAYRVPGVEPGAINQTLAAISDLRALLRVAASSAIELGLIDPEVADAPVS